MNTTDIKKILKQPKKEGKKKELEDDLFLMGNGTEEIGNTIENKGNTTEKLPVLASRRDFSQRFKPIRATPSGVKRATHAMKPPGGNLP